MTIREQFQRPKPPISSEVLESYKRCEEKLSAHETQLLAAGRRLSDPDRRRAFMVAYDSLRVSAPACLPRPLGRARGAEASVVALRGWRDTARLCHQGEPHSGRDVEDALADTMKRFQIPMTPWVDLETGLRELAENEPVDDMQDMVRRARRLAVAPSSVFFRILSAQRGVRRFHVASDLDVDDLTHDPAAFAYMVGLMCDVFKELEYRNPAASSIPRELLDRHRLKAASLSWRCTTIPWPPLLLRISWRTSVSLRGTFMRAVWPRSPKPRLTFPAKPSSTWTDSWITTRQYSRTWSEFGFHRGSLAMWPRGWNPDLPRCRLPAQASGAWLSSRG